MKIVRYYLMIFLAISSCYSSTTVDISAGWGLYGAQKDINTSLFDKYSNDIKLVWAYDSVTKKWGVYSPSSEIKSKIDSLINQGSISALSKIKLGSGFWIMNVGSKVQMAFDDDASYLQALKSGNASLIPESKLIEQLLESATSELNICKSTLDILYQNGLEIATFPSSASYFKSGSSKNIPFHVANNNGDKRVYSWVGETKEQVRYGVLGTKEVFAGSTTVNTQLKASTINLIKWVLKSNSTNILDENLTIVVYDIYVKNQVEEFLKDNNLAYKWTITTDKSKINSGNFDLYISRFATDGANDIFEYIKSSVAKSKPVIVYKDWWISENSEHLAFFNLLHGYYDGKNIGDLIDTKTQCEKASSAKNIISLVEHLKNSTYGFTYNSTSCPESIGKVECKSNLVQNNDNLTLGEVFMDGAEAVRTYISLLDFKGISAFDLTGENTIKLAILLGDKYRQNISYPMDKSMSNQTTFYKALFSDYAVHYARTNNQIQPNLGDFDTNVSSRNVSTITLEKTFIPTQYDEWTTSGVYAPAGKTITIKRTDYTNNNIKIKFNMLRTGSTRVWNTNQYSRPRYTQSNEITIEAGKEYNISTPYGGPIYVAWSGVVSNAQPFTISFGNVVQHPFIEMLGENVTGTELLQNTNLNWIDIKTPFAEIHTIKSNFNTVVGKFNNDISAYLQDIKKYLIIGNLNFAGFKGEGLAISSNVTQFCVDKGLDCTSDIHIKPKIQHINSDLKANCGDGCAGNPYDAAWGIEGRSWGDNHEMGHNLQVNRLKIYGTKSSEVSNNIFPLYENWKYLVNNDLNVSTYGELENRPAHKVAFGILQGAIVNNTAANVTNHPLWKETGTYDKAFERLAFYMQLVFVHKDWEIYTKLYLMERIFTNGIKSQNNWDSVKNTIGFGTYSLDEAKAITTGNDFMSVALSFITGKDHRDYFNAWGIEISQKAKDQITNYNLSQSVPKVFYYVPTDNDGKVRLKRAFPTETRALDGVTLW